MHLHKIFIASLLICLSISFWACQGDQSEKTSTVDVNEPEANSSGPITASENEAVSVPTPEQTPEIDVRKETYPSIFEEAFGKENRWGLTVLPLGKVKVETNKLIVCDPVQLNRALAYTQEFPNGNYSVELASDLSGKFAMNYFVRIRFSDEPVSKWTFARLDDEAPIEIDDSNAYCFAVDAGMATILDPAARNYFEQNDPQKQWEVVFAGKTEFYKYQGFVHQFGPHNLASFNTGTGDGCYSVYLGYDEKGEVCRLLVDFALIKWWLRKSS